jgi:type I restriction enzyme M protein
MIETDGRPSQQEINDRPSQRDVQNQNIAHAVEKSKIAENGEFNLSGERYKDLIIHNSDFEFVTLGEVTVFQQGTQVPKEEQRTSPLDGFERFIRIIDYTQKNNDIRYVRKKTSNRRCEEDDIIMVRYGEVGFVGRGIKGVFANNLFSINPTINNLSKSFLFWIFKSDIFKNFINRVVLQSSMPAISHKILKEFKIPLPPLSVQEEIVAEIEAYQKIIDGAKMVVENYKPQIDIDEDWEMVALGEVCDINSSTINPAEKYNDWFNYIDISSVQNGTGEIDYSNKINVSDAPSRARRVVMKDDILLSTVRPNLKAFGYIDKEPDRFIASTGFAVLRTNNSKLISKFLYYLVFQEFVLSQMINLMGKGAYPSINQKDVNRLKIPLPDIETQKQIVTKIEKEQELVNSNKQLIEIFEQKIKERIAKVWGE